MLIPSNSSFGFSGNIGLNPNANHAVKNPGESVLKAPGKQSSPAECEACNTRKYMDVSDESVSFQTPTHISPEDSFQRVSAFVTLNSKICPECGRSYISGGKTTTQIKYFNETNPYQQQLKNEDALKYQGMHINSKL